MFVAGGSGVTFALSAAQDLVLAGDRSRTKVIEIVWSIPGPGLSLVYLGVCFRQAELLFQVPWKISFLSLLPSYLRAVLIPQFASRCSIHVPLPVHLKGLYSHSA